MESILREFSYLKNSQLGLVTKLSFAYIDGVEFAEDIDTETIIFFNIHVKPKLEKMMKERKRNNLNRQKRKEKKA